MTLELLHHAPQGAAKSTPLLFIHGIHHGAWCWERHFLPWFAARGWDSYALSLRGHGKSSGSTRNAHLRQYVDDVLETAASLPAPPVLIGHSMGGLLVQLCIQQQTFPAAVGVTPVTPRSALQFVISRVIRQPLDVVRGMLTWRLYPLIDTPEKAAALFFHPSLSVAEHAELHSHLGDESFWLVFEATLMNHPNASRIRERGVPLLLMAAAEDTILSVESIQRAALAYGADVVVYPGMAHDIMLDPTWEIGAAGIADWLTKKGF